MVWTAAWTDFVICLLFGWLGVHKFRERKLAWVSFTYVHSDCFVSDGLLTASGTCWPHFMGNASRATDQCRFQQMLHYQLCHQM